MLIKTVASEDALVIVTNGSEVLCPRVIEGVVGSASVGKTSFTVNVAVVPFSTATEF